MADIQLAKRVGRPRMAASGGDVTEELHSKKFMSWVAKGKTRWRHGERRSALAAVRLITSSIGPSARHAISSNLELHAKAA
jgi:hypothetical protein